MDLFKGSTVPSPGSDRQVHTEYVCSYSAQYSCTAVEMHYEYMYGRWLLLYSCMPARASGCMLRPSPTLCLDAGLLLLQQLIEFIAAAAARLASS
jgi:hypothetical protein